jgi:hypothetical protein
MHLFHDTPDYYNTATLSRFWDTAHADAIVDANDGYGGGGALSASSADGYVIKYHDQVGQNAFAVGMRFKCTTLPGANKVILAVVDSVGTIQCALVLKTTGKLAIYRGNLTTQIGSDSDDAITTSTQLDIGFKGTVAAVGGSAEAWTGTSGDELSWARVIAVSNENTAGGSGEAWRGMYVGAITTTFSSHLYMRDGQGAVIDLAPGYYVLVKFPDAAGIYSGYTANTGTLHGALDDTAPDDDTTYGGTTEADQSFSVSVGSVATTTRTIYAVESVAVVKNTADGVGLNYIPRCVLTASTDPVISDGSWNSVSDSTWRAFRHRLPVNPLTGVLWKHSELNAAEWGGYALP